MNHQPTCETNLLSEQSGLKNTTKFGHSFTGKERDSETGYYYFGARYYNSDFSIWLSVDPMADKYPSLSPYNYCAWNPMKLVDPNGDTLVAKDAMSQRDIRSVAGKYSDRITFDKNGVASIDFSGLQGKEKRKMLQHKGVSIISDIIESEKNILYEASDLILATTGDGEKTSSLMKFDGNGVVNLSRGGFDSYDDHSNLPVSGYDGQVVISQVGEWFNEKGFDARVEVISHELAENYARTALNYNYHGVNSAHMYANKRMKNLNFRYSYKSNTIPAEKMYHYERLAKQYFNN